MLRRSIWKVWTEGWETTIASSFPVDKEQEPPCAVSSPRIGRKTASVCVQSQCFDRLLGLNLLPGREASPEGCHSRHQNQGAAVGHGESPCNSGDLVSRVVSGFPQLKGVIPCKVGEGSSVGAVKFFLGLNLNRSNFFRPPELPQKGTNTLSILSGTNITISI